MDHLISKFFEVDYLDIKLINHFLKLKRKIPDSGCIVYSMKAIVIWVCPHFLEIGNWKYEDWVGHPTAKFIHPEDFEHVKELRKSYATKKRIEFYFRILDSDDKYFWMKGIAFPCPETNKIFGIGNKVQAPMPELIKEDMFIKNIN